MSEATPFSLRIFVVDGDPDGLRVVDRTNWNGKALVFPRPLLPKVKQRPEFAQTGVYLLLGPREDGEGEKLYVGEGDPVRPRLEKHYVEKEFWSRAIFFVAGEGQLNKAHVQYLESQLIKRAKAAKRLPLDNGNAPTEPTLSEPDRAYVEVFLDHMLGMLPALGVQAFEQVAEVSAGSSFALLTCSGKGVKATGYESTKGFVVKAGSQAVGVTVPSMKEHVRGMYDLREDLIKNGVLATSGDQFVFSQDYAFSSPSTAAAVLLGRSANGRIEWKDHQNRTLKELQESQANLGGA
ncbi:MAG: GIY-YIG nuclease family protein [Betaproteobacteria bacterium]|jgi:hypothetical protein